MDSPWPGHLTRYWHAACDSRELRARPVARTVLGVPLVLFRGAGGRAAALIDRCPHRNFPLSLGRVRAGELECRYHGWRFDPAGACLAVPALVGDPARFGRAAEGVPLVERHGFAWVWLARDVPPSGEPFPIPLLDDASFTTVRLRATLKAPLAATLENILDVPHTAFLHRGLFRTGESRGVFEVVTRRTADRVEAEYLGEPRPSSVMGNLLAPGGGVVTHVDRFVLPSIAQVEYGLGDMRIVVTHVMTPVTAEVTRVHFVATYRLRIPGALAAPFVWLLGRRIIAQDARALRQQSENVRRFGGERFHSTEVDVLGPHVMAMLEQALEGEALDAVPREWRTRIQP